MLIFPRQKDVGADLRIFMSAGPGMSVLVVLLLVLLDLSSWWPSKPTHRAALATLVSSSFWLLLLFLNLAWTMTR